MRTQAGLASSPAGGGERGGDGLDWNEEYDGRERGSRRKKVYGYLKAANELRQAYSAQWAQRSQGSEERMPGDFPGMESTGSGNEEMVLFPSYGRRHTKRDGRNYVRPRPAPQEQASKQQYPEDLAYWQRESDQYENDNAVVDIDVRGWIFSPHRGPMNRKQRILVSLAKRLSGIPTADQNAAESTELGPSGKPNSAVDKQEDALARKKADSIMKDAPDNADEPQQPLPLTADEIAAANAQLMERLHPFITIPADGMPTTVFFFNDTQSQSRTVSTNEGGQFTIRASLEFVPTHVRVLAGENLSATEEVKIMEPKGISLISDIDDTIKHSAISDGAKEMFRNTFVRNLNDLTIAGVNEWYSKLASMGVGIHYVSNSPWQLYPLLKKYFTLAGLPPGSFHLKQYSGMLQGIFEPTSERKRPNLESIIQDFPDREFILVGDSGEADLEIYTDLVVANPGRIIGVFIRDITTPTISKFFDKSISHLGTRLPTETQKQQNGLVNIEKKKPTLPPRRYQQSENQEPDAASGVSVGNLIDLEDNDEKIQNQNSKNQNQTQSNVNPRPPARPSKPISLRGTDVGLEGAENSNKNFQTPSDMRRKPVPPRPKKPARLSSGNSEAESQLPPNYTHPTPIRKPPTQQSVTSQTRPNDDSYATSLKNQATNMYNQLPSAKEYIGNLTSVNSLPLPYGDKSSTSSQTGTKGKQTPPPVPPPRRTNTNQSSQTTASKSTSDVPNASSSPKIPRNPTSMSDNALNRLYSPPSSRETTPQGNRRPAYPIRDNTTPSTPPNKREELWNRRWARASEILSREGVVLARWRVGGDVQDTCFQLVKRAQQDIDSHKQD